MRGLRGRTWIKVRSRLIHVVIYSLIPLYRILPAHFVFACLTVCEQMRVPAIAALKRAFVPIASRQQLTRPDRPLTTRVAKRFPNATSELLFSVEAYQECCDFITARSFYRLPKRMYEVWSRSLFELGRFREARDVLTFEALVGRTSSFAHLTGHIDLVNGDVLNGLKNIERAAQDNQSLLCPHQNLAARNPSSYTPTHLDAASGPDGLLFDAYNYIGQRVTHVGEGHLSTFFYAEALAAQRRLMAMRPPSLSNELNSLLNKLDIRFAELRILPTEWYTQVGHQGMLDMLFRMREFGWWHGKVIFLMPPESVANSAFQSLFDLHGHVVQADSRSSVARELFSLQRWCGMNFNAFPLPSGEVVPWQEAGAKLMVEWDRFDRGSPVRESFDRVYGANKTLQSVTERWREVWGMGPDDWYVCLHMRDASHYGEVDGSGQTHRNAGIASYLQAIQYITSRGGWVVKLGGPRSPKLPRMPRVIDYARSKHKSEIMDVQLIRHARFFIGTTSGLTNVAVSFGVACALVNCITTDAQLWGNRVRFALKRIRLRDETEITQRQITSAPWRWRVFGADVLARYGASLIENSGDEILEIVKEVEALADGEPERYTSAVPDAYDLLRRWRQCLTLPHFYGAGQPSLYFLKKHEVLLSDAPAMRSLPEPVARPALSYQHSSTVDGTV